MVLRGCFYFDVCDSITIRVVLHEFGNAGFLTTFQHFLLGSWFDWLKLRLLDLTESIEYILRLLFYDSALFEFVLGLTVISLHAQEIGYPHILIWFVEEIRSPPVVIDDIFFGCLLFRIRPWEMWLI